MYSFGNDALDHPPHVAFDASAAAVIFCGSIQELCAP